MKCPWLRAPRAQFIFVCPIYPIYISAVWAVCHTSFIHILQRLSISSSFVRICHWSGPCHDCGMYWSVSLLTCFSLSAYLIKGEPHHPKEFSHAALNLQPETVTRPSFAETMSNWRPCIIIFTPNKFSKLKNRISVHKFWEEPTNRFFLLYPSLVFDC